MSCWTYSLKVPCTDLAILPSLLARALEQGGWWYDSFVYTPSPMSRIPPAHHYNHLLKISDALAFWVALFRVKKGCLVKKSKQSFFFNTFFLLANIAAFIYDFFFFCWTVSSVNIKSHCTQLQWMYCTCCECKRDKHITPWSWHCFFSSCEFLLCHTYKAHTTRCLELCIWYKSME